MATYNDDSIKELVKSFDKLGFTIKSIDNKNEQKFTNDEVFKDATNYTSDTSLYGFYVKPIVIVNNLNQDVYDVHIRRGYANISDLADYMEVDEKGNLIVKDYFTSSVKVILAKKGTKEFQGEIITTEEFESLSEFANFDDFESIDAPDYSVIFADDPQVSVVNPPVDINAMTDAQIKKAEQKLKDAISKWEQLKNVKAVELKTAMWSFDEIDEMYNTKITTDDKRAFFIYLQNKTRKKLKGDWDAKYGSSYPAQANDILGLMVRGALFYDPTAKFGERLQPKVIYKSGNIWRKWGSLTNNKDEIVSRFGEAIYQKHIDALEPTWIELNKNRLSVRSEDKSMRLFLSPISSMAKEITINEYFHPKDKITAQKDFEGYTNIKDGEVIFDPSIKKGERDANEKGITQMLKRLKTTHKVDIEPLANLTAEELKDILINSPYYDGDWFKDKGYQKSKFTTKKSLTLYEAFISWCRDAGVGLDAQQNGIQWTHITLDVATLKDYYLKVLYQNPFSLELNGKDKWQRYKNDAKKVGERLFAQFLDEGLTADDQRRVEYIWNSTYNAFTEPVLEEVPIGFSYRKYLDGDTLFIMTDFNLRAIRYYLTRGSVGLAYGVGIGKTFCSIFVMKQALDLGLATRPLIIVPNQVYSQFKTEIFRALGSEFDDTKPNSRVNGFYNGMDEINTIKGNNAKDGINICTYNATQLFQFYKPTLSPEWIYENCAIIESAPQIEGDNFKDEFAKTYAPILFNEKINKDKSLVTDVDAEIVTAEDEEIDTGDFARGGGVPKDLPAIYVNTPATNYDMIVVDEAHNFNNLFEGVVMEAKDDQTGEAGKKEKIKIQRDSNPFSSIRETGGKEASSRSQKLWFLARYVQSINKMGNTILLSATPFTNSPLQVYSMMSLLNWDYLYENDMGVIGSFFLNFAKTEYTDDFKTDLSIIRRVKFIGWNNVVSLQKYVYKYFDKSTREDEDANVIRPNKFALPLKRIMVDGSIVEFAKENYVSTTIRMSDLQQQLWSRARSYAQPKGGIPYDELCDEFWQNTTIWGRYTPPPPPKAGKEDEEDEDVEVTDGDSLDDGTEEGEKAKNSAKALQCLQWGRQIAMNPYVFKCSGFKEDPTPAEFVEQSPKLLYVVECIRSVKEWHESQTDPQLQKVSGQVIYMDFTPSSFPLIRDYLVEQVGFTLDEIGIISGSNNFIGKKKIKDKQVVADAFLGRVAVGEKHRNLPENKRLKVLIGSSSIKEGINLQKYGSVLYNCFLDFNPTDRIQVEGRIWRQGNLFKNVRIVTPLMSDCIDIFMFQKLEDKTERINQIWTRNSNVNELDTTSFNPSELKYELLTDPNQIAILEASQRKDMLTQKRVEEGELLSQYLTFERIFEQSEMIINKKVSNFKSDERLHLYYNISIIRPDLLLMPLLNKDGFKKYAETFFESEYMRNKGYSKTDFNIDACPNIYTFMALYEKDLNMLNYDEPLRINNITPLPLKTIYLSQIFNYSIEDLVKIMVMVLKEQKIGYPVGYSKNWRDLLPKPILPIMLGEEVEFDNKNGRLKGIVTATSTRTNVDNLANFYYTMAYDVRNQGRSSILEEATKIIEKSSKLLTSGIDLFDVMENNYDFADLPKEIKLVLVDLFKVYFKNIKSFLFEDGNLKSKFTPYYMDVEVNGIDIEDLEIEDRNIVPIRKTSDKKVEPTKYPEPFTYSNKDRVEIVDDINQYTQIVLYKKYKDNNGLNGFLQTEKTQGWFYERDDFYPLFDLNFSTLLDILNVNYWSDYQYPSVLRQFEGQNKFNTWAEMVDAWKGDGYGGLFKRASTQIYNSSYAQILAEFKLLYQTKMLPIGITTYTDAKIFVTKQKEVINAIAIEIMNLDDAQVMQELIQEVIRRQNELNSEEIRAGSTFKGRANMFANSNSDYLGNNMLGLQYEPKKQDEEEEEEEALELSVKSRSRNKKIAQPVVAEEVIIEESESEIEEFSDAEIKMQTQELISQLKPALKFYEGAERKEFQEYLKSLQSLVKQLG